LTDFLQDSSAAVFLFLTFEAEEIDITSFSSQSNLRKQTQMLESSKQADD